MRFYITLGIILFAAGCTDATSPEPNQELNAKQEIKKNLTEAEQARMEYLALKAKREKETAF